jgi:hypothetical protein
MVDVCHHQGMRINKFEKHVPLIKASYYLLTLKTARIFIFYVLASRRKDSSLTE